jgi:hypothetical protein
MPIPAQTEELHTVWGRSATEVYAIGRNGTLLKYDGVAWKTVTTPLPVNDVWSNGTDLFVTTAAGLYWSRGSGWLRVQDGTPGAVRLVLGVGASIFFSDAFGGGHQLVRLGSW